MEKDATTPSKPQRKAIRLKDYDYSSPGYYFVTICTRNRESLFGEIVAGIPRLNVFGEIVAEGWTWLSKQYGYVGVEEWTVMPNHFHGILEIRDDDRRGGSRTAPAPHLTVRKTLGRLVGAFKTISSKRINGERGTPGDKVWQRSFYDHIIRNDDDLFRIRKYVFENPLHWAEDEYNPAHNPEAPGDL